MDSLLDLMAATAEIRGFMKPHGRIQILTMLLILGVGGVGYWSFFHVPLYLDNMTVRDAVASAANSAKQETDDRIMTMLLNKVNAPTTGTHRSEDDEGNKVVKGGLGLTEDDVLIERDSETKKIRVKIVYTREFFMWPSKELKKKRFVVESVGETF